MGEMDIKNAGAGIGIMMQIRTAHNLMNGAMIPLDDFSYHYYSGVSKRLASMMPAGHWSGNNAHTGKYLAVASSKASVYVPIRDKYILGGQMLGTESGDTGGGNT